MYVAHIPKDDRIMVVLFSFAAGHSAPCISVFLRASSLCEDHTTDKNMHAGGAPIGVSRIRRVHIAAHVAIPNVVRIVAVSRPAETVLRCRSLQPI